MFPEFFFNNFNRYINIILFFSEEIVIILIIYNFIKVIILGVIVELILPTHFFNKKNNVSNKIKFRNLNEFVLKLRPIDSKKNSFNKNLINFFLFKKNLLKKFKKQLN